MDHSFGVVIGTYGTPTWEARGITATMSVLQQTRRCPVEHVHGLTLAEARNAGARRIDAERLVFLDADDTLDAGYIEAMAQLATDGDELLQPATLYPGDDAPSLLPAKPLDHGNFMVIGTAIRRDQFLRLGGFLDWPLYEDWCLWIRAWQDGATLTPVPDAVYRIGSREPGRNEPDRATKVRYFNEIRSTYFP